MTGGQILGIEIGGTKLQLGLGGGDEAALTTLERARINPDEGRAGILRQIEALGAQLMTGHSVRQIAVGFGGPVDVLAGRTVTSHQVEGWDDFPICRWLEERFALPVVLGNDCDCAALAEARWGAGRDFSSMFYVTVGTGIGGGWVQDGRLQGRGRPAIAEIGHLRPAVDATDPHQTVEAIASGRGIEQQAAQLLEPQLLENYRETDPGIAELREAARQQKLDVRLLGELAEAGNQPARELIAQAIDTLGWAIAQVITLVAPERVVVGGGVSLLGPTLFFEPLREACEQRTFPPLRNSCEIVPPLLGEEVVVHGAIALALG